ncbi:uncharacterized protein LOC116846882 isoform X2 [Odontomachus brunneus]|uniref:uncharacterized protein LOC116846882 isoform X2 n=1 Tax=Odontomachus brunneus TaxID=486640 RepID=UPI0013F1A8F3|nr:uncharacterized protein LOC116846882 isoform X2 [Odontomachus brunneus]
MLNLGPSSIRGPIVNYNNFFSPYVCHVCKTFENLQVCHWCRLISYCCKEHLELHREQHKEFCLAVLSLSDEIYYSHDITLKEWTQLKKANVKKVKHKLGRNLEPYEEQILLFAKSCLICRRQNNLSVACEFCMSVSMCYRHISTPYEHNCFNLWLCIQLDIINTTECEPNIRKRKELLRPLTLLFNMPRVGIPELRSSATFTIHVIAGSFTDQNSLLAWEVFTHRMCLDSSLLIIMIESKLENHTYDVELCQTCFSQNKNISISYYPMTYRHYIRSEVYLEPDIVIGFNVDFEDDETAIRTALIYQNKPLILTCKSESKAQETVTKIKATLRKEPVINEENKFASCRPYRDAESDFVFFFHQYLIIYCKKTCRKRTLDISSNHNELSISDSSCEE